MPKVPKGHVVFVEGEEGGSDWEDEGGEVAEKASRGRTWRPREVGGCIYRTKLECNLKRHRP